MSRTLSLALLSLLCGCPSAEDTDTDFDTTVLPPCLATQDNDADQDGVADDCDQCEGNDLTGDRDADGVCDDLDPCPLDENDDSDGDGVCDTNDVCEGDDLADEDGDGVPCSLDCDDTDANSFPMAMWFLDADDDGFGDDAQAIERCEQPDGYVAIGGDCDDAVDWVHPGATEWCDGIDTDCNVLTDEPARAAHVQVGDLFTDITEQFPEGGSEVWASSEDAVLGLCGIDGSYAFDIAHDVQVVGVHRPQLTRADRPPFMVGNAAVPVLDPDVRLHLSGVGTIGASQPLVRVDHAIVELSDIRVQDGIAQFGSVVQAFGADVTVTDLVADGLDGRAFWLANASLTLLNAQLDGFSARQIPNVDAGHGGAIHGQNAALTVHDSVFTNNRSGERGGAVFVSGGTVDMDNVQFQGNSSFFVGGSVFLQGVDATLVGVEITDGLGFEAGALYLENSTVHAQSLDLIDNTSAWSGGAVRLFGGVLHVDGGNFIGNTAGWSGGAVFVGESPPGVQQWSVFRGTDVVALGNESLGTNPDRQGGGAFAVHWGTMHLTNPTLRGNRSLLGSAVFLGDSGSAVLDGPCSVTSNVATGRNGNSGALHVESGVLLATGCTFGDTDETFNAPRPAVVGPFLFDDAPDNNLYCASIGRPNLSPGCGLPSTLVDDDADGVHDLFDVCPAQSDLEDDNSDGEPCWTELVRPDLFPPQ